MPSELIVNVTKISKISPHTNADALEIAEIGGWQVVVKKDMFINGDLVVYFPPDTLLPIELSDKLGVTGYLSVRQYEDGLYGRVKSITLRGEPSFGLVSPSDEISKILDVKSLSEGDDLVSKLKVKKFTSKDITSGDPNKPSKNYPDFYRYTDIKNMRHYLNSFVEGENVVILEKLHGTNARTGLVKNIDYAWYKPWTWGKKSVFVIGSHNKTTGVGNSISNGLYATTFTKNMQRLLKLVSGVKHYSVVVYSEIYGNNVQDLTYGAETPTFAVYDISICGVYVSWDLVKRLCNTFDIPTVPVLYKGEFSIDLVKELSLGKTTIPMKNPHMREGCVVRPICEKHESNIGRKILKYVSSKYLTRKRY